MSTMLNPEREVEQRLDGWTRLRGLAAASTRTVQLAMLGLCLALTACSGGGPEGAAKQWLDALNDGDLSTARELSTEQTQALLQMTSALGEDLAVGKYKIVSVKEVSKTRAEVVVRAEKDDEQMTLDMRKIDGEWKVGISK